MDELLPSPTKTPPPAEKPSISVAINSATRKQHVELNRLIVERLPLGLPPHSHDPALLGRGLAAFGNIFSAFEEVWHEIEQGKHALSRYDPDKAHAYDVCSFLSFLRPTGLARGERLRKDLAHIQRRADTEYQTSAYDQALATRIRTALNERPHALIAYAWVMYMAIFSGGRWIREQLAKAGPCFWLDASQAEKFDIANRLSMPGFIFLSFSGDRDGEDIKADFQSRLEEADTLLTDKERDEVVDAAKGIFDDCLQLIHDIDKRVQVAQEEPNLQPLLLIAAALALMALLLMVFNWFGKVSFPGR
jgi:heme oxygenase